MSIFKFVYDNHFKSHTILTIFNEVLCCLFFLNLQITYKQGSNTTLWIRNIQMGISSLILGFIGVFLSNDRTIVLEHGFFYGYTVMVWAVILLQAIGGLVVAVVVKYADNILKGFAASFSIVTSCLLCYFLFDFKPNILFLTGAV